MDLGLWDYRVLEKVYEYNVLRNEEPTVYRLVEDFGRRTKPVVNALKKLESWGLLSSRIEAKGRRKAKKFRVTMYGLLMYLYRRFKEREELGPRLILSIAGLAYFTLYLDLYLTMLSEIPPEQREERLQRSFNSFRLILGKTLEEFTEWLERYLENIRKHTEALYYSALLDQYLKQHPQICEKASEVVDIVLNTFIEPLAQQNPEESKLRELVKQAVNYFKTECSQTLKEHSIANST